MNSVDFGRLQQQGHFPFNVVLFSLPEELYVIGSVNRAKLDCGVISRKMEQVLYRQGWATILQQEWLWILICEKETVRVLANLRKALLSGA